ncbi:glycosyltransferase, partial [Clostridium sp. 2-1]|uniref:glycosyltransferase n=1 Tax=Clostridium sp. 2-1 TaxID=2070758 RepID=UPI001A9A5B72
MEKQLLSLLNQTRKADEVIIKDDCSTDHTAEVVTEFIQKNNLENWDFSVNKSNLGYKRNFYEAIKQANG